MWRIAASTWGWTLVAMRARLRRHRSASAGSAPNGDELVVEIAPGELSGMLAAAVWMRDLVMMAWLLVGVGALLVGAVWLLAAIERL
jgi:hypothetical protein